MSLRLFMSHSSNPAPCRTELGTASGSALTWDLAQVTDTAIGISLYTYRKFALTGSESDCQAALPRAERAITVSRWSERFE